MIDKSEKCVEDDDPDKHAKRKCVIECLEISSVDNAGLIVEDAMQDKVCDSEAEVQSKRSRMGDSLENVDLVVTKEVSLMSCSTRIEMPLQVDTDVELRLDSEGLSDSVNDHAMKVDYENSVGIESDAAVNCLSDHDLSEKNEQHSEKLDHVGDGSTLILSGNVQIDGVKGKCLSDELVNYPPKQVPANKKKLLVLDINGLLADIVSPIPKDYKSDAKIARRAIFKRPFCTEFLTFCFETFEVGIWSSRTQKNVERVIDFLLGDLKNQLLFCWDVTQCTDTGFRTLENWHKTLVFKEIRKLWEPLDNGLPWEIGRFNESNTLLVDDSPYKALLNPLHTAIFPQSFSYQDRHDTSLGPDGDIRAYLEGLAAADNVQDYVQLHPFGQEFISQSSPSWDFYYRAVISLFTLPTPDA